VKKVYKYFVDNFEQLQKNGELAEKILATRRDESLFLNIDGDRDGERLNWVKGSSLAIDCHLREETIQGVRSFLRPFEEILEAAGALKVLYPSYVWEHNKLSSESGISSSFDRLRRENALIDVVFRVEPTQDVPDPELLFAHRTFLAVSSEYFRDKFCAGSDSQESRNMSTASPLTISVQYSWKCVRTFLSEYYFPFQPPRPYFHFRPHLHEGQSRK